MSTGHHNIYITLAKMLYGYLRGTYVSIKNISTGDASGSYKSPILHEIISRGPAGFREHPTAIRLGRALFAPLILISHLYEKK